MRGAECSYAAQPSQPSPSTSLNLAAECFTVGRTASRNLDSIITRKTAIVSNACNVSTQQLLEHYLNHTSKTLATASGDPRQTQLWESVIPAVAFSNAAISHGLMALSALCMARDVIEYYPAAQALQRVAESHYGAALSLLQDSLMGVYSVAEDEILAGSMVLMVCGFALEQSSEGSEIPGEWLLHLRAFVKLRQSLQGSSRAKNSSVFGYTSKEVGSPITPMGSPTSSLDSLNFFDAFASPDMAH